MAIRRIGSSQLATGAVTSAAIASGAIDNANKFASGVVDASAIATGAVGADEIAANAVAASELADGAVDAAALGAGALSGSGIHDAVKYATAAALPAHTGTGTAVLTASANGALSVDGFAVVAAQRILHRYGAAHKDHLIYVVTATGDAVTPWVLTRDDDSDAAAELPVGSQVYVEMGTANGQSTYRLADFPGTLGTDALTWEMVEEGLVPGRTEGVGDGADVTFDLGAINTLGHVVFIGGVIQPVSEYAITPAGGTGGLVDLITFDNAPANLESFDVEYFTRS